MEFNNWKEADTRATEIKTELDGIIAGIAASEIEARKEDISVETRERIITDIQGQVTKRDALQKRYDETIEARDKLKTAEERQFGLLSNISSARVSERAKAAAASIGNVYETREYEMAWANYVRTGRDAEVRALINTQDGKAAGIMVPHALMNKIEDTMRTGGRLINLCDIIGVKGIVEYPVAVSRTDPEIHAEIGIAGADPAEKKEKSIELTSVNMDPQFVAEFLRTTRKFENDSLSGFWDWIMTEFPDALRRVVDRMILIGPQTANYGIHGILTNTNSMFVTTLSNHELVFNTPNIAVSMLDEGADDNITMVMNRQTFFQNFMGLDGLDGHPIWKDVFASNTNKPAYSMGGYPVVFTDALPAYDAAAKDAVYMVAGNFRAMKLNFPDGFNTQIIRDDITEMTKNIVRYRSEIYVAGNIVRPGCFVKVTKGGA